MVCSSRFFVVFAHFGTPASLSVLCIVRFDKIGRSCHSEQNLYSVLTLSVWPSLTTGLSNEGVLIAFG